MATKRKIEIFSADCQVCQEAVEQVKQLALYPNPSPPIRQQAK